MSALVARLVRQVIGCNQQLKKLSKIGDEYQRELGRKEGLLQAAKLAARITH